MLVLNRVVKDRLTHAALVREIHAAARRGARKGFELPQHLYAEWVMGKEGCGGVEGEAFYITVPYVYAAPKHRSLLKWFVGHELSHVWQAARGGLGRLRHDDEFYDAFKAFCAPTAMHHELRYRPRAAKKQGIVRRLRRR